MTMKGHHSANGSQLRRAVIINWIKYGVAALALTLALMYFSDNRDQVQVVLHAARLDLLLVSVTFACVANVLLYVGWCVLTLGRAELKTNALQEFSARSISELGKYIPGRVVSYFILHQYRDRETEREHGLITSAFWELFGVVVTGSLVAVLAYTTAHVYLSIGLAVVALLTIVVFHPHILNIISLGMQKLRMERAAFVIRRAKLPRSRIVSVLVLYVLSWGSLGVSAMFVIDALIGSSSIGIMRCIGAVSVAGIGGMAVLIAPAGIGAKDVVLAQLLQNDATVVEIATVVVCVRFATIIADILVAGVGYLVLAGSSKKRQSVYL